MMLDTAHFTPWLSLAGGLMLGIASSIFILVHGRILGISGIVGGLLAFPATGVAWRVAFLLGLAASALLPLPTEIIHMTRIEASYVICAIAGLLVGFGSRYGSGCTSGHGVCGLSRLSLRSLAANLTFMSIGFFIVYVIRQFF